MSKTLVSNAVRILPADTDFLNRKTGSRGEIVYDQSTNTLRVYNGVLAGGYPLARNDLNNVSNSTFLAKAAAAGVGGAGVNSFQTIAVAGQSNVVADSSTDTLTLAAGSGIAITTNAGTDTVTISATGSMSVPTATTSVLGIVKIDGTTITINNGVISATGQTTEPYSFNIAGDDSTLRPVVSGNTIKFLGQGSVNITTDVDGVVTITGDVAATTLATLTDAALASLTVDMVYMPAMTRLNVTRTGSTAYLFDQYSGSNPTIFAITGTTIAFKLTVTGHPFLIQDPTGTNYNTGLVHVSTTGTVSTGADAQGKTTGTLFWKVPSGISGNYRYQCGIHAAMVGAITVKDIAVI